MASLLLADPPHVSFLSPPIRFSASSPFLPLSGGWLAQHRTCHGANNTLISVTSELQSSMPTTTVHSSKILEEGSRWPSSSLCARPEVTGYFPEICTPSPIRLAGDGRYLAQVPAYSASQFRWRWFSKERAPSPQALPSTPHKAFLESSSFLTLDSKTTPLDIQFWNDHLLPSIPSRLCFTVSSMKGCQADVWHLFTPFQ